VKEIVAAVSAWFSYMDDPGGGDVALEETITSAMRSALTRARHEMEGVGQTTGGDFQKRSSTDLD
jgi:hypothetical protein